jgi:alkylation response protein AidB-like acyl-CoA dehydrogenase
LYLPKLVDGSWAGTMCLTEAHCGTDLGLLRTKAVPQPDGSYKLTGSKIFISAGEHDLTENIIHLVLARLPDAPPGIKGISLFVVPKFLPKANGRQRRRGNGVKCTAHRTQDGHQGIRHLPDEFRRRHRLARRRAEQGHARDVRDDEQRTAVGGHPGTGHRRNRLPERRRLREGPSARSLPVGTQVPRQGGRSLIVHPDVRRMLMTMRAYNEGCRALGVWVANALDRMERSEDPEERQEAEDFIALMTPVVKALFTDLGFEARTSALQTYGGHGFIVDHGMEQFVRDARIAMIYEGTNGIQALDLVGRKLPANMGRSLRRFFHPVAEFIDSHTDDKDIGT